jgi:ubiquinone/menaquinone biosynthesis C-methylase UbiE
MSTVPADRNGPAGLTSGQARRFYDRFGRAQDLQAFYEDRAARDLVSQGRFADARTVLEAGCGTGRLAARLLDGTLRADASYLGADISGTMTALATMRLRPFGGRAQVIRADATRPLPVAGATFDRFVAVYLLDLLNPADAGVMLAEARRVLRPGGLLCTASLTPGMTPATRLVSAAWMAAWSRAPWLTGGCRPVTVAPLLDGWHIEHRAQVSAWALTSEIVIASR